jgi:hypothetical protein
VHHVNGVRTDNRNSNLVLCNDAAYHKLLHRRAHALAACGHAGWRICRHCREWDAPENLYVHPRGKYANHRACARAVERLRYAEGRRGRRAAACA